MVPHQHNFMVWQGQWKGAAEKKDFLHLTTQKNNVHPVPTNLNLRSAGSSIILAGTTAWSTYSLSDGPPPTQFHGVTGAVERCSWKKGLFAYLQPKKWCFLQKKIIFPGAAQVLASACNCSTYSLLDGPPPTQFHGGTWAVERCSCKKMEILHISHKNVCIIMVGG